MYRSKTFVALILFAPVTKYDLGMVPQYGGIVKHNFIIKNIGVETLKIGIITTSCACTSAEIDKKTILAGDEAILTVVFDPDVHAEPLIDFPEQFPLNPMIQILRNCS